MSSPWIRRTALALGALLLLLAVAAGVLVAGFDANRYKGLAVDWMKAELQRTLVIDGPIEAIDWKIQWSGVAAAAIENQLKDRLAEKLGAKLGTAPVAAGADSAPASPQDRLKEKLKGLFK